LRRTARWPERGRRGRRHGVDRRHEISETITDPDFDAWYDAEGSENGDKCAWTFGATHAVANGAQANMVLEARQFLLQQLWSPRAGGSCALE
jgi:hypothetical protein